MRHDFSDQTKRVLAGRVGHRCSNLRCGAPTIGPTINPVKALNLGVAAHITAASPGGPRYDSSLSQAKRKEAENGIWLCQNCAKLVDNDPVRFPADQLRVWKRVAEERALAEIGQPSQPSVHRTRRRYVVCAFDFDGTLLRGPAFRYSWQLVWSYLGYDDSMRRRLFREYIDRKISYDQWCAECLFYFRQRQLCRQDFHRMAQTLKVTNRLREAINLLHHEQIAVGVISGGIDTFVEVMIPDYRELFDFIYINRFIYDEAGYLIGVTPTQHDFEGKSIAFQIECERRGATFTEGVFVGEGKNDAYLIQKMHTLGTGLTIAYPPNSTDVELFADEGIEQDDLLLVAEAIITRM